MIIVTNVEDNIINAMEVLSGKVYLRREASLNIISKVLHKSSGRPDSSIDRLTDREFEVLQLLGSGLGTRKIAKQLNLSVNTVETHRRHISEKFNLKDSDELVQYAIHWFIDSHK